jgi:hypothetical protein
MSGIKKPSIKKPVNGIKKPAVKPKAPVIKEEVVEEKVIEIPVVVDQVEEIAPELEEILAQDEKHQEQEEQQIVEEVNEEPVQEPEPEPVVEEKPKAKKSSRKSTKKKEESKEEVVEENLPNMELNDAVTVMGKMCPTLPEWEEAKLEIEDKLRATAIDPDIDPSSGRMLIGEIDGLLCELRVYKVDQEAEVKAITEMVEYIRLSNATGTNSEERKANGYKALMNHKTSPDSTETINLIEYKLFYESKLAFFNEAIEILKDRKQLLITFQGMMKIESNF